jgi:NAD(P)-dependent dehydrogenase (short-subunit alcohol dehydrogenase family)
VTGAADGIGAEIARRLRAEGARVLITYLSSEAEARRLGQQGIDIMRADVTSTRDVNKIFETARARFDRLDILVNAASASVPNSYNLEPDYINPSDFDHVYKVDLMGTFLCCRAALPMLRRTRGAIVNFSSSAALQGDATTLLYSAAKAGVDGFTRALARKVAPEVRVNAVAPGSIEAGSWIRDWKLKPQDLKEFSDLTPLKRLGQAPDVAAAVLFLVSDDAAFITGQTLIVDGGYYSK